MRFFFNSVLPHDLLATIVQTIKFDLILFMTFFCFLLCCGCLLCTVAVVQYTIMSYDQLVCKAAAAYSIDSSLPLNRKWSFGKQNALFVFSFVTKSSTHTHTRHVGCRFKLNQSYGMQSYFQMSVAELPYTLNQGASVATSRQVDINFSSVLFF